MPTLQTRRVTNDPELEETIRRTTAEVFGLADSDIKNGTVLAELVDDELDYTELQIAIEGALKAKHVFEEMEEAAELAPMTFSALVEYVASHRKRTRRPVPVAVAGDEGQNEEEAALDE